MKQNKARMHKIKPIESEKRKRFAINTQLVITVAARETQSGICNFSPRWQ